MKITHTKKILRGLRYCSLPKLIDRRIEISSIKTVEADIFAILGGDLPADSRLIVRERKYLEGAIVKYGIIDAEFSVSMRHFSACSLIDGATLRELGFVLSPEDKDYVSQKVLADNGGDAGLLDFLADGVEKNKAMIKLFLKTNALQSPHFSLKLPENYFPQIFVVADACMTNSGYVWFNKHFYM